MRYATGYCFNAYDLFETFNTKTLKIKRETVQKKYGVKCKQAICASVLIYCCYLILLDIIKNNITFVLPLFNNKLGQFYAKPIVDEEFKNARKNGAFQDIDFLASDFTGYRLTYQWTNSIERKEKNIYINKKFKDAFTQKINNGQKYY